MEEHEVLEFDRHSCRKNQRYLHHFHQPLPLLLHQVELRCNASRQDRHQVIQSFHVHQSLLNALRMVGPCALVRHKLRYLREGAAFPLLRQQHERSLHVHDLDAIPSLTSGAKFGGVPALNHHVHQEVPAHR